MLNYQRVSQASLRYPAGSRSWVTDVRSSAQDQIRSCRQNLRSGWKSPDFTRWTIETGRWEMRMVCLSIDHNNYFTLSLWICRIDYVQFRLIIQAPNGLWCQSCTPRTTPSATRSLLQTFHGAGTTAQHQQLPRRRSKPCHTLQQVTGRVQVIYHQELAP
jgi:hypothetical protein